VLEVQNLELWQVAQLGRVDPGDPVVGEVEGDQGGEGGRQAELREGVSGQVQHQKVCELEASGYVGQSVVLKVKLPQGRATLSESGRQEGEMVVAEVEGGERGERQPADQLHQLVPLHGQSLEGGEAVEGREGGEAVVGEVEGGEGGEGEPGAEGRPVEEGDALPRHLEVAQLVKAL